MANIDDAEQKRLSVVQNERTKLRATYLNGVAIAVFAVGGFAPVISYLSQIANAHYGLIGGLGGVCVVSSWWIHTLAQRVLKDLVT